MARDRTETKDLCDELGINYDEPDDFRFWSEFDRKQSTVDSFRYHKPSDAQVVRIAVIRSSHTELAKLIMRQTTFGADQVAALRKLHECMMTCNKAIVCEGEVTG